MEIQPCLMRRTVARRIPVVVTGISSNTSRTIVICIPSLLGQQHMQRQGRAPSPSIGRRRLKLYVVGVR